MRRDPGDREERCPPQVTAREERRPPQVAGREERRPPRQTATERHDFEERPEAEATPETVCPLDSLPVALIYPAPSVCLRVWVAQGSKNHLET